MAAPGLGSGFAAVMRRDLMVAFRRYGEIANPLMFYIIVTTLFPLALSPDLAGLRAIAPAVLWVAALLSSLLALEALFRSDHEDGSMEQLALAAQPLAWLLLAKLLVHWLLSGLPLLLLTPLLASALALPAAVWPVLLGGLALGTVFLSAVGAIGAALTMGLKRGSMLLALLVLPLVVPVLVFGARATDLSLQGDSAAGPLWLLAALALAAVSLAPVAMALAIRISLD